MSEPSLGKLLEGSRQKRGLSLRDVAHKTRIPVQRLQQLETDNYAAFGSMTYARAFLRQYCAFLGLDASKTLEALPSAVLGGPRDYRYLVDNHGLWVDPRAPRRARGRAAGSSSSSVLPQALVIFLVLLVATGMFAKHLVLGGGAPAGEVVESPSSPPAAPPPALSPPVMEEPSRQVILRAVDLSARPGHSPSPQAAPPSGDGEPLALQRAIPIRGPIVLVPGTNKVALPPSEVIDE